MTPSQEKQKERARQEAEHHLQNSSVTGKREKSAAELNADIQGRWNEWNEPDKSIFGPVGSRLREEERKNELRKKYAEEDKDK